MTDPILPTMLQIHETEQSHQQILLSGFWSLRGVLLHSHLVRYITKKGTIAPFFSDSPSLDIACEHMPEMHLPCRPLAFPESCLAAVFLLASLILLSPHPHLGCHFQAAGVVAFSAVVSPVYAGCIVSTPVICRASKSHSIWPAKTSLGQAPCDYFMLLASHNLCKPSRCHQTPNRVSGLH